GRTSAPAGGGGPGRGTGGASAGGVKTQSRSRHCAHAPRPRTNTSPTRERGKPACPSLARRACIKTAQPQAAGSALRAGGRGLFLLVQQLGQLRLLACGQVLVDDALGRGPVELHGREVVFLAQVLDGAAGGHSQHLLDLRLQRLLDGAVVQAALLVLPQPFLGTFGVRHRYSRGNVPSPAPIAGGN